MNDTYRSFMETFESPNTFKVVKSYQAIGDYDYTNCTEEYVENIILNMQPNTPMAITRICSVFTAYAKYLNNNQLQYIISNIDRNKLWERAKPNAPKKFISNKRFKEVYKDIGMFEELNPTYYQSLFRCLYEGIYNDDMSVIKNLRASDINGNIVTLHEDNGNCYDLEISTELAEDLKELGLNNVWERRNRYGVFQMKVDGICSDSCFKVEIRNNSSQYAYRYSYYRLLRKIVKEYVEYNLLPKDIFISGIMYRITLKLKENNISLEEAFSLYNRDDLVAKIISDELKRCNHIIDFSFKEVVKGHIDVFDEME